jgi:recombinational DNA repair ATPase RecF
MRIKSIELSWFRGAADPVSMELNSKSLVVYGANASGKSSFVDAMEYTLNGGRIRHLAHEYSGKHLQKAVPNTHKPHGGKTELVIKLMNDSEVKTEIEEDGSAESSGSALTEVGTWDYRRTVLRQDEIVAFIQDTKGGKYSALLPLLGLHQMEVAAENLRQVAKNVESLSHLEQVKGALSQAKIKRNATFGTLTDDEILEKIEELHTKYCADKAATKDALSRCADLTAALEMRTEQLSAEHRRYITLRDVAALDIKGPIDTIRTASIELAGALDPLIAQKLALLQPTETLIGKLTAGEEVPCPACGQSVRVEELEAHVKAELERLKDIRATFGERNAGMGNLCDAVRALKIGLGKLEVKSWRDESAKGSLGSSFAYLDGLNVEPLRTTCSEQDLQDISSKLLPLVAATTAASTCASPDAKQLSDDKGLIETAKTAITSGQQAVVVTRAETLVFLLNTLEQMTREEIRLRSNTVIAEISEDIRQMWAILHPKEAIEHVHLYLPEDADKAIDIGLKFHGKELDSPRLTLSEGYRNSLGLCIFLAMAKREAKNDRPVFLDDVVVSLDRNHRGMIVDLLKKEFIARQVVILTHDREWYTELHQLLDDKIWAFKVLLPYETPKIGIRWSHKTTTFDDARAHVKTRPDSAANDARKIMDVQLALIAENLQIKLPYLRFDRNDRRVAHDFLERLVADGEKCFQNKTAQNEYASRRDAIEAFRAADELLVSWGNRGSHSFDVEPAEANKLIDVCEAALAHFKCGTCGKLVWFAEAEKSKWVQCQCGGIRWRYDKA